jgi:hypothetical protein
VTDGFGLRRYFEKGGSEAMGKMTTVAILFLIVAGLAGISCQKANDNEPEGIAEAEVWVLPDSLVFEQVWVYFVDKPEEYFEKAVSDMDQAGPKVEAHDLRTAAAFMKVEAGRSRGESAKAIKESIDEIEDAARRVGEEQEVIPSEELDRIFARAHLALAEHHFERASGLLGEDQIKAGEELDAAASHVEHGVGWLTPEPDQALMAPLKSVRETAGELAEGKLVKPEVVSKAMTVVEKQIEDLRAELRTA